MTSLFKRARDGKNCKKYLKILYTHFFVLLDILRTQYAKKKFGATWIFTKFFLVLTIYWIAKCKKEKSSKHCEFESKIGLVRKAQTKVKGFAELSFKIFEKT